MTIGENDKLLVEYVCHIFLRNHVVEYDILNAEYDQVI